MWGTVRRETNTSPCNTKNELKAMISAEFLGTELFYNISRDVYIFLVNISDKVRCQFHLHLCNIDDNSLVALYILQYNIFLNNTIFPPISTYYSDVLDPASIFVNYTQMSNQKIHFLHNSMMMIVFSLVKS